MQEQEQISAKKQKQKKNYKNSRHYEKTKITNAGAVLDVALKVVKRDQL